MKIVYLYQLIPFYNNISLNVFILTFPSWININNGNNLYVIYFQYAFYFKLISNDSISWLMLKAFEIA